VSFAVNLMSLLHETGSIEPRPMGGKRHGKLDSAEAFILDFVERTPDVTMPELATALLAERGITGLNWPRPRPNGSKAANPSCVGERTSETAPEPKIGLRTPFVSFRSNLGENGNLRHDIFADGSQRLFAIQSDVHHARRQRCGCLSPPMP
jgi:hypothetical protein